MAPYCSYCINDLPDIFNEEVTLKLFADDVKLYWNIAVASSYTSTSLAEQLNKLVKWSTDWQLPIAYSKCCVFNIGSKTPQSTPCIIDSGSMPSVEEVVDLGVTLHKSLKFSYHVSAICCKAHRRANLFLNVFILKTLHLCCLRS